jgi:DNA-binding NarL/FixJ family response regulator
MSIKNKRLAMKIIVADDHTLFREGVRHILTDLGGDVIVLQAGDYAQAETLLVTHPDADLAIIDLKMPGMEVAGSLKRLTQAACTVPIVILSASEDPADMQRVLQAGVMGFIPKSESPAVILNALRLVLSGSIYIPPAMLRTGGTTLNPGRADAGNTLTPRQRDVLHHMAQGISNKEIGRQLEMSEATVKAHVTAILKCLNVSNRTQAVSVAERLGLFQRDR